MKIRDKQPHSKQIAFITLESFFTRPPKKSIPLGEKLKNVTSSEVGTLLGFAWILLLSALAMSTVLYFSNSRDLIIIPRCLFGLSLLLFVIHSGLMLIGILPTIFEPQKWFVKTISHNPVEIEIALSIRTQIVDTKTLVGLHSFAKLKAERLNGYGKLLTVAFGVVSLSALSPFLKPMGMNLDSPFIPVFFGVFGAAAGIFSLISLTHDNEAATVCAVLKLASEHDTIELQRLLPLLKGEELNS